MDAAVPRLGIDVDGVGRQRRNGKRFVCAVPIAQANIRDAGTCPVQDGKGMHRSRYR